MKQGKLFILSGQSGVGKNTILKSIISNHPDFHRAVTFTTRNPRLNEVPGEDHYFVYRKKFQDMIDNNELLEWAEVNGELYGTPKDQVTKILSSGHNAIMEIDVQGATNVKKLFPQTTLIFIKYEPGDLEQIIRSRIKNDPSRSKVSEKEILRRIQTAKSEAEYEKFYDFTVLNPEGKIDQATSEVEKIIQEHIN
ncbi:MAG: Guanylate kinase [Berkelbacteria bacterium GW2011_GWA1_39_10]|uniref:Guanylate kinase n=1 Tax=Berkelbacteria bacterium GW2011_GWA1_39_10 TaxID=1618332 RepID=A0A0G0LG85_9BACT|nr:MAG: Guanylate kinase [Berkelbacteria bacterium GW2011_GWA1_39_10]